MKKILSIVALAVAITAWGEKPDAEYYYPAGIQQGTTSRIIVGGQYLDNVKGGWITGEGVEIVRVTNMPNPPRALGKTQGKWLRDWCSEIAVDGIRKHHELPPEAVSENTDWVECDWWTYMEQLDDLELSMIWSDSIRIFPARQYFPAISRVFIVDIKAAEDAPPGRREIILYDSNDVTVPHAFYVSAAPRYREPNYRMPFVAKKLGGYEKNPTVEPPCVVDGQVFQGETDVWPIKLKKGQTLVFSVVARELLPFLGDAVPGFFNPVIQLFDPNGNEVACADDFFYLPDPIMTCVVPEDGLYRLEMHDNLYRGRQDFVYMIDCAIVESEAPVFTPQERAFECYPASTGQEVPKDDGRTVVRAGKLECPGRTVRHYFNVDQPYSRYTIELFARRQGSPLDAVIKLYGPVGNLPLAEAPKLGEWDDSPAKLYDVVNVGSDEQPIIKTNMLYVGSIIQVERDPVGQYTFEKPGRYCVTVSDVSGAGGDDYTYILAISPNEPSFEVYGLSSSYLLNENYEADLKLQVLRLNGFKGPIVLDDTEDVQADSYEIDNIKGRAGLAFRKKDWRGVKCIQLTASARLPNGNKKTVRITPTDPAEQAFAYSHMLPQHGFYFCVPPEKEKECEYRDVADIGWTAANAASASASATADAAGGVTNQVVKPMKRVKKSKGADHANGQPCSKCHQDKKRRR